MSLHPRSRPTARHLPTLVALLVAVAVAPAAARAQSGITFRYTTTGTGGEKAAKARGETSAEMVGTVRMAGANARIDFTQGGSALVKDGGYMLVRGADRQFIFVSPKDKSAMILDAEGLGAGLGSLTNNALLKMTMKDARFAFEDLGAGERILGRPTRHVRTTWGSTVEVRMLGRTQRSKESSTAEVWLAPTPAGIDADGMRAWGRSFGIGLQRTNPEMAQQMADYDRKFGDGLALRRLMVTERTDDKGKVTVDTVRMEVTDLQTGRLDPELFRVPSDYQTSDMRQLTASIDSARKADAAARGVPAADVKDSASAKPSASDAVKGALGGFLRRKKP